VTLGIRPPPLQRTNPVQREHRGGVVFLVDVDETDGDGTSPGHGQGGARGGQDGGLGGRGGVQPRRAHAPRVARSGPELIAVVMTDRLELDAEGVGPEGGVVMTRILRKVLWRVNDVAAQADDMVMNAVHQRPSPNHEGEML
jgi:hypothetical protein